MKNVSAMVKEARQQHGLNQEEMAVMMDVSVSSVAAWEGERWGMKRSNLEVFKKNFPEVYARHTNGAKTEQSRQNKPQPSAKIRPYNLIPSGFAKPITERLRYARKKAGLSFDSLPHGIQDNVQAMEQFQIDVTTEIVMSLCKLYQIEPCWVLTGLDCEYCQCEPTHDNLNDDERDMAVTILDLIDLTQFDGTTRKALEYAIKLLGNN